MPPKILGEASARFTDHIVKQADALQYELGLPCLIAWAAEETVLVNDVRTDPRWQWSAAVAALPIRSVVSAPLISAKECIGALKIYAPLPSYDQHTAPLLELFAAPAATLLSHIQTTEAPKRTPRRRHYTFHYTFHSAASPIRSPGGHVSLTIQGVVGGGR
jgi:GAF domain-containing protein